MAVSPANAVAGRRLLQAPDLTAVPEVLALLRIASPIPVQLFPNATADLAVDSPYNTEVLPMFQLTQVAPPAIVAFAAGEALPVGADGLPYIPADGATGSSSSSSDGSSGGGGLSTGAIVGIAVGCAAGVALVAGAVVLYRRRSRARRTEDTAQFVAPSTKGSALDADGSDASASPTATSARADVV